MRFVVALLFVLAWSTVDAQEVYRWVDENGVVHYSDQPRDGAERVRIGPVQGYESTMESAPAALDPAASSEADSTLAYTDVRIVSPPAGEPLWATGGVYTVVVETVPALQPGHRIELVLNGQRVAGTPAPSTRIELTGLVRGEHTLQAAVVDAGGQWLLYSNDVAFTVLQASVHQPQRRPR